MLHLLHLHLRSIVLLLHHVVSHHGVSAHANIWLHHLVGGHHGGLGGLRLLRLEKRIEVGLEARLRRHGVLQLGRRCVQIQDVIDLLRLHFRRLLEIAKQVLLGLHADEVIHGRGCC